MVAFLLNPRKRKRRSARRGKARRTRRSSVVARRRARRSRSAKRAYRHRMAFARGSAARRAVQALACGPISRLAALRRRCPAGAARSSRSHGGIAGIIAARRAPGAIVRNPRGARFSYRRRKARNYSTWLPSYGSNPYWVPQYAMNPGIAGKITAGYKPSVLLGALPYAGGALGNALLSRWISGFMPGMLQSGAPNLLVGLASAGLLGAGVGMVAPRYAAPVFFGGVIEIVTRAARAYVMPAIGQVSGLFDYLTVGDAANARPLGDFGACCNVGQLDMTTWGIGHELSMNQQDMAAIAPDNDESPESLTPQIGFSDYLSVADAARARPLGYLGYTMNDAAIEGTATTELGMD